MAGEKTSQAVCFMTEIALERRGRAMRPLSLAMSLREKRKTCRRFLPILLAVMAGAASGHRPGHLVHVDPHAADRLVQAVEAGGHVRDAEVHRADATI